jgi:hypothetical protein
MLSAIVFRHALPIVAHFDRALAVSLSRFSAPFLSSLAPGAIPAAAFLVEDVDYEWKPGVVDRPR